MSLSPIWLLHGGTGELIDPDHAKFARVIQNISSPTSEEKTFVDNGDARGLGGGGTDILRHDIQGGRTMKKSKSYGSNGQ